MLSILSFLQGHGLSVVLVAFTVASILLNALGQVLQALGKQVPGWVGSVLGGIGSIVHFLNGYVAVPAAPADPAVPAAK